MTGAASLTGRYKILLVEDDPVLSEITVVKLQEAGFEVRLVRSAEEALSALKGGPPVDAVFSDVILPGETSGFQLARIVRAEFPGTAVLLTTGFSSSFDVAQVRGLETVAKPYDYNDVAARLAELIRSERSS